MIVIQAPNGSRYPLVGENQLTKRETLIAQDQLQKTRSSPAVR
jgi:hypothetical protein